MRVARVWNDFWFERGPADALGLFRIAFALCLALEVPTSFARSQAAIIGDGFSLSYLTLIPHVSPELYRALHLAQYPFIALLAVGVLPRVACAGLVFTQGWIFFADQLAFRNHPYFFLLVIVLLAVSPCAERFSLSSVLRRAKRARRSRWGNPPPLTAQRLLQVQVSISYFFATLQKINADFTNGRVFGELLRRTLDQGTSGAMLELAIGSEPLEALTAWVAVPQNMLLISWATIATELFLAFGLWWPRTRWLSIGLGTAFHLGIGVSMDIWTFTGAMLATYLLFVDPAVFSERLGQLRARIVGASESARVAEPNADR